MSAKFTDLTFASKYVIILPYKSEHPEGLFVFFCLDFDVEKIMRSREDILKSIILREARVFDFNAFWQLRDNPYSPAELKLCCSVYQLATFIVGGYQQALRTKEWGIAKRTLFLIVGIGSEIDRENNQMKKEPINDE